MLLFDTAQQKTTQQPCPLAAVASSVTMRHHIRPFQPQLLLLLLLLPPLRCCH
jgi:hypothetical protein